MAHSSVQLQQPAASHYFLSHKCLANNYKTWKNIIIIPGNNIFPHRRWKIQCRATARATTQLHSHSPNNYQPSSWSFEFMESLANQNYHMIEVHEEEKMKKMEKEVRCMVENEQPILGLLELIDDIHRLGIGYRFQESTKIALERLMAMNSNQKVLQNSSLRASALYFRLLRQQGYHVSADIFESFKGSDGNFPTSLAMDIEAMLSLFEASHLAFDGESILDEAREFTSFHLRNMIGKMDKKTAMQVSHALEIPFHHRTQRLEARWNIEMFDKQDKPNQSLLNLAILDFNMVQLVHQRDLQEVSRWWRDVGLANKLRFARDRLMESFFWAAGMVYEPQFSKCRIGLTKVVKLITILDDIYDVHGSPKELEQFTDAVDKWDVNAVNYLPDYMKICFFALYNTVNDMAYDTLKEHDQVIIFQLRKGWADLCRAFLREAEWNQQNHIPKFDEYLEHGWVSSSGALLLNHAYFLMTKNIREEAIHSLNDGHGLLRFPCTIFRLANDRSSSKEDVENGEVAKAASCYMQQTAGSSIEAAEAYLTKLIHENWKKTNNEIIQNSSHFEKPFIQTASNLARIALCQYQFGDAHTAPDDLSRNRVKSVIIEPIRRCL